MLASRRNVEIPSVASDLPKADCLNLKGAPTPTWVADECALRHLIKKRPSNAGSDVGILRYFCWRSDHSLMELHVLLLILNFYIIATGGAPDLGGEKNLVGTCCVIWLFRAYSMGKARLLYCCVLAYIAISQAMRKAGGNGSVALSWVGFPLSILSFVPKVLDVTGQWIWGTALFHVLV
eukprot:gene24765-5980_t